MLARHALTILAVEDLARAVAFYRAAFGWPELVAAPVYHEFSLPERMRLGLYEREGFGRNTGQVPAQLAAAELAATELYFYPDDLDEALRRMRAAGARELAALAPRDWGDEAAYFADPEGNVLVLARPLSAENEEPADALRAVARRWLTLWERDDRLGFEALHAADFVDHSPAGRGADRDAFRQGIVELREAFPDFAIAGSELLVDAPQATVTVRWSACGTHRGAFLGLPASGRRVRFAGIEVIRVAQGQVVERWGEWDGLGVLEQLG